MIKSSTSIITKLLVLAGIIILFSLGIWLILVKKDNHTLTKQKQFYQVMPKFVKELQQRWETGDLEGNYALGKFKCPLIENGLNVSGQYFQCNALYLDCYLKGLTGQKVNYSYKVKDHEMLFEYSGEYRVGSSHNVQLKFKEAEMGQTFVVNLQDTCKDSFLPQGIYSAGPKEGSKYNWDNYGQQIFLDKQYVSNKDVYFWQVKETGSSSIDPQLFHLPNTTLSIADMKKFCADHDSQLMQNRLFDAAAFVPGNVENNYVFKFPYPWTKKRSSFLTEGKVDTIDCDKAFVRECKKLIPYKANNTYSASWMGIFHMLGSYKEVFENKFEPLANLKVSSMGLSASSPWHVNGARAYWDGEKLAEVKDYNKFKAKISRELGEAAFRCFRIK